MRSRISVALSVFLLVTVIAGCEGERGPVGPAGPAGPSIVICYGTISSGTVESSWPADVTVSVTAAATGIWDVTLTGAFPETEGMVMTTLADGNAARSMTSFPSSWSSTTIVFRAGIWNVVDSIFIDGRFSFVVMADVE